MPPRPRRSLEALWLLALALVAQGCHRELAAPTSKDLTDLTVALERSPGMSLVFPGQVGAVPARVRVDVTALRTLATRGCFESEPQVRARVKVQTPAGEVLGIDEVELPGLRFGAAALPPLPAGLERGDGCEVTLAQDVVGAYALEVALAPRTLAFRATRPREAHLARAAQAIDHTVTVLELSREPRFDWPLLPVQVRQAGASLTAPFVLSTNDARSQVSPAAADGAGLKTGLGLFDGLPLPDGLELPQELRAFQGVAYDALELAPGVGVRQGSLRPVKGWTNPGLSGLVGGDVWGRFDATIDLPAGVLVLSRPRVLESGSFQRCQRGEALGEDACFELDAHPSAPGLETAVTVWRGLPLGGRLLFDVQPAQAGERLGCRVGITFPPQDRGASSAHVFPWARLAQTQPGCAELLRTAKGATLSAFEESPVDQCPGTCAFVQDLRSRQVSCECEGGAGSGEGERRLLELYRHLIERQQKAHERALEPEDP